MSRKRPVSEQTLPQAKRQIINLWIESQTAHPTIELIDGRDLRSSSSLPPFPTPKPSSQPSGQQAHTSNSCNDAAHFCEGEMTSAPASEAPTAESNISIAPDMPDFEDQLHHRGVRSADKDYKHDAVFPSDWQELERIRTRARESPEPTPDEHKEYRNTVRDLTNEPGVMAKLVPKILKSAWETEGNTAWEYDKSWITHVPLPLRGCFRLTDPKPDQAIGWKSDHFAEVVDGPAISALAVRLGVKKLGSYASPCTGIYWPVVTLEGKGAAGQLRIARLQNLYNASIMLNNQHELCCKAGRAHFPYERIMALTIVVTAESAEVHCHWISKAADGSLIFWGRLLDSWGLNSPQEDLYIKMRRTIRNSVEWVRAKTSADIRQDLDALRRRLQALPQAAPGSSRQKKRSEEHNKQQLPTPATSCLPLGDSIIGETREMTSASQSYGKSSASSSFAKSPSTRAATSSISRRRKQTPSMLVDPEGKNRRGQPPPQ